jgi:hypothetical protein
VEALQDAVVEDIARARQMLADAQVVEYREYLDCGYSSTSGGEN